jgi:transposase
MAFLVGIDRFQIRMSSLDEFIAKDNPVRFVEAFVEHLDLSKLGFEVSVSKTEGRPAFDSKVFLKLYFYGYLNGLRSSRRLERECMRNLEVQWLLNSLQPNYHTIADFRKNNPKALQSTFKLFVGFLRDADLVAGNVVAIDGTKVRASNSKKNNYNPKKIARHLEYIETKTNEYLQELEENDQKEADKEKVSHIQEKINRLKASKIRYEAYQEKLDKSTEPQISATDSDARALLVHGQVVELSYNVQAAVDQKHNLVIGTHTINRNDRNALTDIALETQQNIGSSKFTVLVDKGYHNGREIENTQKAGIKTIVATPELVNSNAYGTTAEYMVDKFIYHQETDTYTCPQGKTLQTTGTWHTKSRERDSYKMKKYRTPDCKQCTVRHLCTFKADGRREIERSQYADAVELNKRNYLQNKDLYRKRQEINEHIFGTIKRQWGYNYTNLRGLSKVNGEMALIMTVYNIKRAHKILGFEELMKKLKNWEPKYPVAMPTTKKRLILSPSAEPKKYAFAQAA